MPGRVNGGGAFCVRILLAWYRMGGCRTIFTGHPLVHRQAVGAVTVLVHWHTFRAIHRWATGRIQEVCGFTYLNNRSPLQRCPPELLEGWQRHRDSAWLHMPQKILGADAKQGTQREELAQP